MAVRSNGTYRTFLKWEEHPRIRPVLQMAIERNNISMGVVLKISSPKSRRRIHYHAHLLGVSGKSPFSVKNMIPKNEKSFQCHA